MATTLIQTIQLHKAQSDFRASSALYRGYVGGRGAGKSWIGTYDLLRRAEPDSLYGVYAPTYGMLKDATLRSFLIMAEQLQFLRDMHKGDMRATLGNGAEVLFRSVDDPERARGPNLSGAYLDEASLMQRAAYEIIIAALREGSEPGWLSATFTPKGRQHWTYEVFGQGAVNTALFRSRTQDNPFLPHGFFDAVRAQYTSHLASQELDGAFVDAEGAVAQRDWFPIVDVAPAHAQRARYWDFAATSRDYRGDPDYTVGTLMCEADGRFYVEHVIRDRWGPGEVERVVRQTAETDGHAVRIGMEQEPGSSGKLFVAAMIRALAGWDARGIPSSGDKLQRAMPFMAQAEAGNVSLVRGAWNKDWLDEVTMVPNAEHDDQWDGGAGAFTMLSHHAPPAGEVFEPDASIYKPVRRSRWA